VKLRSTLAIVTTTMSCVAVVVAVGLVILTSALSQFTARLETSVERMRLLIELESHALQAGRDGGAFDPDAISEIVGRLSHSSDRQFSSNAQALAGEIELAASAATSTDRRSQMAAAMTLLREVVHREDREARRVATLAAAWHRIMSIVAVGGVSVLLLGFLVPLIWFRQHALQPLADIADAIERFAAGDRAVRAPQVGPSEFRQVAASFNEMAGALQHQHERQLAFVGGIAHDLRNPLSTLRVASVLLQRQPHDVIRLGERITHQIDQLERLVNDLLDRTRIEAGQLQLCPELIDLRCVIDRVVDEQRTLNPTRDFNVIMPDCPALVRCDVVRIEQVIQNLLSNAVKYSADSTDIEIRVSQADSSAAVSVTDRGVGVELTDRERLFQPFMRGENVGRVGGIGLGLSVTKKIVEGHRGRIEVVSTPGTGSTFVVHLPLAVANPSPIVGRNANKPSETVARASIAGS
jgi:two-component system, OmpR family, sensor histidine kinase MtrB